MILRLHLFPWFFALLITLGIELSLYRSRRMAPRYWKLNAALCCILAAAWSVTLLRTEMTVMPGWIIVLFSAALASVPLSLLFLVVVSLQRAMRNASPQRRRFLLASAGAAAVGTIAITSFGIIRRNDFHVNEVNIPIPGLQPDLHGLRIVQLTDIHLSPFLHASELARAVDIANHTRAHLALVTGDLITRRGDPLDACLRELARLRADAGVLGCLGNHEIYAGTEDYTTAGGARIGIQFLRGQARQLRFGNATLNVAGYDYQRFSRPYLAKAESLVVPGALNVMLSHNPDTFPAAAGKGYQLSVSGHTHGGQVNFELLHQNVNAARFFTPFVRGLYRKDGAAAWVSTGLGTVGVPIRLGVPPEVSVLTLCAV